MRYLNSDAVLVGYGSIGKKHLIKLSEFYKTIHVVEPNPKKMLEIVEDSTHVITVIPELGQLDNSRRYETAVIANWGPDHFTSLETLIKLGVKKFIVEKPLVTQLAELYEIRKLVSDGVNIGVNMPWMNANYHCKIEEFQKIHCLGSLESITVSGGAKCLVTIGIHYLGLAINLFNEPPNAVCALANGEFINPRSNHLQYLDGSATWRFPSGKSFQMSFSNNSHLQAKAFFTFRYGRIEIENESVSVYRISPDNESRIVKKTNTFYTQLIEISKIVQVDDKGLDGLDIIYSKVMSNEFPSSTESAIHATESIIAMLISNELGRVVNLPFSSDIRERFLKTSWPVS